MALGACAVIPFQAYSLYTVAKLQYGYLGKINEGSKEASLGLGDAILNYKTV
jgi:hypothetical protein